MLNKLKQVKDLLVVAADDRSNQNEKNNAVKAALKIVERIDRGEFKETSIVKFDEPDGGSVYDDLFSQAIRDVSQRTHRGPRPVPSGKSDTRVKARAGGKCVRCEKSFDKGDTMIFLSKERRFSHPSCYHEQGSRAAESI